MPNRSKAKTNPRAGAPSTGLGAAAEADGGFSLISNEKLLALYKNLLQCRMAATRAGNANGTLKAARQREAAIVASAIDLCAGDVVCSPEEGWLSGVTEGAPIDKLLLAFGMQQRPGPPITETAIGTALAYKTKKNGKVAVMFSTESPEGLRDAVEIASVHALPLVFFDHSSAKPNGHVPAPQRAKKSSSGEPPWFPSITVDLHDVVAVYRVASEAISRARKGRGPTLIACRPYRLEGTAGKSGSPRNGRHAHDAVVNMEHYLRARGLFDAQLKRSSLPS